MRDCMKQFQYILDAGTKTCIWVQTSETEKFIDDLAELFIKDSRYRNKKIYLWDIAEGLQEFFPGEETLFKSVEIMDSQMWEKTSHITGLLSFIKKCQLNTASGSIFIIKNLHLINREPMVKQMIANLYETKISTYTPLIIISEVVDIPQENEKMVTIFHYDLPDEREIRKIVSDFTVLLNNSDQFGSVSKEEEEAAIMAAKGLTANEIVNCLRKSIREYHTINTDMILKEKIQIIKQSGCLDFREVSDASFDDMGGNEQFKEWINEIYLSQTNEAEEFGVTPAKGFIAFGVPGSGKSASAEMCAALFHEPLLELNFSKIMGSMVGQSEKAIDKALSIVKATAPCVLLIDEAEKSLGGYKSSASSDSGTLARVLGRILTFMQDNQNVFVVLTSNDITKLPPELLRAGRLDTHWYFGIPTTEERKSIIDIYLNKKKSLRISEMMKQELLNETESFTGAEIRAVVENLIRKVWVRGRKENIDSSEIEVNKVDIEQAAANIVPVYRSSEDIVTGLKAYAQRHALFASKQTKANKKTADIIGQGWY